MGTYKAWNQGFFIKLMAWLKLREEIFINIILLVEEKFPIPWDNKTPDVEYLGLWLFDYER